ncbi:MAG: hypothetical protein HOH60_10415 [Opitutae bacterium]|nr:hypothetical protein [Opitutae bacterium]
MEVLKRQKKKFVANKQPPNNSRKGDHSEPDAVGGNQAQKYGGKPIGNPFSRYGYSLFAILIFISGIYVGLRYLSDKNQSESGHYTTSKKTYRKVIPNPQPEDFFPVAEFRKQGAILLGCHNQINLIPELYGEIAKAVNQRVPLFGVVSTEAQARSGAQMIENIGLPQEAMRFLVIPSNSIWIRDYAPFILRYDQQSAFMVDAKYRTLTTRENRKQDDFMCFELAHLLGLPVRSIPLVLEGGNFISNGDGLLITSAKTIRVNQEEEYTNKQLISMFNDFLGVNGVCAVNHLKNEPNGHIDMFMTMLGKNLAVVGEIDPIVDSENSAILNEVARVISSYTTSDGPITVKRIPMPPQSGNDWRSYTNIIMANGVLLMPSFSNVDPAIENRAEQVYQSTLPPDWVVKRINCDKLVALRGQLHCMSYNIPNFISIDGLLEKAIPKPLN